MTEKMEVARLFQCSRKQIPNKRQQPTNQPTNEQIKKKIVREKGESAVFDVDMCE